MNNRTIELAVFKELQDTAGADFVVELVDTFLADAPPMLKSMHEALGAGDADGFRRAAHSLKSNGHTFGAMALGALARELEQGGLDGARKRHASGESALDALDAEYARVAAALTQLRNA